MDSSLSTLIFSLFHHPHERQAVPLAGHVRGIPPAGLHQVGHVEGTAYAEKLRLECVTNAQLAVYGLLNDKAAVALVAHEAVTVGQPTNLNAISHGKARRQDLPPREERRVCAAPFAQKADQSA